MVEDEVKNAWDKLSQQNRKGHIEVDSNSEIISQKRKIIDIEIIDNNKNYIWVASHQKNTQKVSRNAKKIFLDRNKRIKRKVKIDGKLLDKNKRSNKKARTDRSNIYKVRKKAMLFES